MSGETACYKLRMDCPVLTLGFTVATFVLAGFVKGMIGIGLPTVAMGLLAMVMTPAQAASLLVVPSFVTNIWQAVGPGLAPLLRRLWPMLLGICVGAGGGGLLAAETERARPWGWGQCSRSTPFLASPRSRSSCRHGGAVALAAGRRGHRHRHRGDRRVRDPAAPYLQAIGFEKDELVQAFGLSFTVSTVALAATLVQDGALQFGCRRLAACACAGAGRHGVGPVGARSGAFRNVPHVLLRGSLVLGAHLVLRALI